MNWTLGFPGKSDKLLIGQHLLLSPVSTAVKSECSVSDHRPDPILGCVITRRRARLVEEHRFDLLGKCPTEDNVNRGHL